MIPPTTARIELEPDSSSSSTSSLSLSVVGSPTGGVDVFDDVSSDGDGVVFGDGVAVSCGACDVLSGVEGVSESVSEKVPNGVLV